VRREIKAAGILRISGRNGAPGQLVRRHEEAARIRAAGASPPRDSAPHGDPRSLGAARFDVSRAGTTVGRIVVEDTALPDDSGLPTPRIGLHYKALESYGGYPPKTAYRVRGRGILALAMRGAWYSCDGCFLEGPDRAGKWQPGDAGWQLTER